MSDNTENPIIIADLIHKVKRQDEVIRELREQVKELEVNLKIFMVGKIEVENIAAMAKVHWEKELISERHTNTKLQEQIKEAIKTLEKVVDGCEDDLSTRAIVFIKRSLKQIRYLIMEGE